MSRTYVLLVLVLLLHPLADSKDKNKAQLPAYVLRAQTVVVVINPGAGEPLTDPSANRRAQEDVEKALTKWGRFRLVMESQTADLVIAVRRGSGRAPRPAIIGGPTDNRPVIVEPTDGSIRIGAQHGNPPELNQPGMSGPRDTGPHVQTELGPAEDTLELYRGGVEYPLDSAPVWRYMAKDALRSPAVPAIERLRKAVEEEEKTAQRNQKP